MSSQPWRQGERRAAGHLRLFIVPHSKVVGDRPAAGMTQRGAVRGSVCQSFGRLVLPRSRFNRIAIAIVVLLAGAVPLLIASPAPLQDWPNHIAGAHVLDELLRGDGFWGQFYKFNTFFIPNVLIDAALLGMIRLGFTVLESAQIVVVVTYLTFIGGFCALARSLRAFDLAKLPLATILFYNGALFWGLVSYLLGIGLMLLCLALWIDAEGLTLKRHVIAATGAAILFFCHLIASAVFVMLLGVFEFIAFTQATVPTAHRFLTHASWLTGALTLLLLLSGSPTGDEQVFHFVYFGHGSATAISGWKLHSLTTILLGGGFAADASTIAAIGALVALAFVTQLHIDAAAAMVGGFALLLVLVAPERIGSGTLLDYRLGLLPFALFIISLRIGWRHSSQRRIALGVMAAVALVHSGALTGAWLTAGSVYAAFRRDAAEFRPGSIIIMAYGRPSSVMSFEKVWALPIASIETQAALATAFAPSLFANPLQQPMTLRSSFSRLGEPLNLTGPDQIPVIASVLRPLCNGPVGGVHFANVYLAVKYPGVFSRTGLVPSAIIADHADFQILDGCRLVPSGDG